MTKHDQITLLRNPHMPALPMHAPDLGEGDLESLRLPVMMLETRTRAFTS